MEKLRVQEALEERTVVQVVLVVQAVESPGKEEVEKVA
jgi:hypothetical protein